MPLQQFLIAPIKTGLQSNARPWMFMDDAFQILQNMHVWRGRIKKRFGALSMYTGGDAEQAHLFSRFRIRIGTTDVNGDLAATMVPGIIYKVGQMFSCGTEVFTVNATGTPAATLATEGGVATYNTTTGFFTLTGGAVLTDVYFYPAEPVMDLPTYQVASLNEEELVGFDTQFAYQFSTPSTGWLRLGTATWTGTNADFYSTANFIGATSDTFLLFVVNNVPADGIKYWDGVNWTTITPQYSATATDIIKTAKITIVFKNYLFLANTTEDVTTAGPVVTQRTFIDRLRYCRINDPVSANAWRQDLDAGVFNLGTREAITGMALIKDRLIVQCESSYWEIVDTGNPQLPFFVQRIDNQLGVESLNSIVNFDKYTLGFGSNGIHRCDGVNVDRIDNNIPDTIFEISNLNNGPERVFGIRDYYTEEVYWSYSDSTIANDDQVYPNQLLIYNYKTGSWAKYDDSITAFGYYQSPQSVRWIDLDIDWQDAGQQWGEASDSALFRSIVAGNQEGFTFLLKDDYSRNSASLQITNIAITGEQITLTVIEHNLEVGDYVYLSGCVGLTGINDKIYDVLDVVNTDTIRIAQSNVTGTYLGNGVLERVSKLTLLSKQYNFFNEQGKNLHVPEIVFNVDVTQHGQFLFDYYTSFSALSLQLASNGNGTALGTNILETIPADDYQETATQLWRSLYPLADGDVFAFKLTMNDTQMRDTDIVFSDFQLHAILIYAEPTDVFGY